VEYCQAPGCGVAILLGVKTPLSLSCGALGPTADGRDVGIVLDLGGRVSLRAVGKMALRSGV